MNFVDLMVGRSIKPDISFEKMQELWYSEQYILEPIQNGKRYQCLITDSIDWNTLNANNTPKSIRNKIIHVINKIEEIFPKDTLLDGYISCGDYSKTMQILESSDEKANEIQRNEQLFLKYEIMDIIYIGGYYLFNFPLFERKRRLKEIEGDYISIVNYVSRNKKEILEQWKNEYNSFYFKDLASEYVFGNSSKWKIYKEPQIFYGVIMNIIEGRGKYKNMAGSLEIGMYVDGELKKITNIGGMNTDQRVLFFHNSSDYIGKIVEIKALEKSKNNLLEARFENLAEDKTRNDCIF